LSRVIKLLSLSLSTKNDQYIVIGLIWNRCGGTFNISSLGHDDHANWKISSKHYVHLSPTTNYVSSVTVRS